MTVACTSPIGRDILDWAEMYRGCEYLEFHEPAFFDHRIEDAKARTNGAIEHLMRYVSSFTKSVTFAIKLDNSANRFQFIDRRLVELCRRHGYSLRSISHAGRQWYIAYA